MGKSDKLGVDKLVKRVTGEFEKAQQRVEKMVSDALSRIDSLQNQVQELRDTVRDRVGFGESTGKGKSSSAPKGATKAKKSSGGSNKSSSSAASKSTGSKAGSASGSAKKPSSAASKTAGTQKGGNDSDLTRIKGIGPATADKMRAKGITSIKQIANPSADDKKKLEDFSHLKSFSTWQSEAKKLV